MGKAGPALIFPSRDDVIAVNRYHIESTGGFYQAPENLASPGSLEWVLSAIQYPLFGTDPYPSLVEKAAVLAWTIIADHTFFDGNKRTGVAVLKITLRVNGYDLTASDDELIEMALAVAGKRDPRCSLEEFTVWIRSKLHLHG